MNGDALLLFLQADRWRIASVAGDDIHLADVPLAGGSPLETIPQVAEALKQLDQSPLACLGLPSSMIFAAQVDCDMLPRKKRRTAMLFRLEEQLPLDVERLTADFLPAKGGKALGLAVETSCVKEILDQLEAQGVTVTSVCSSSLLAASSLPIDSLRNCDYLIVAWPAHADVLRMSDGQPVAWYSTAPDAQELDQCLCVDMVTNPPPGDQPAISVIGTFDAGVIAAIRQHASVTVLQDQPDATEHAAARSAQAIARGRRSGWVDFRQGALATPSGWTHLAKPAKRAVALAALLLVVLTVGFGVRTARYEALAAELIQKQQDAYHALYPLQEAPVNIKVRLLSDLRRLSGTVGADSNVPDQPSALETLRSAVASLPAAVRLRIVQMRIAPNGLLIEGQSRSHSDAETITQAISRAGFAMDPPHTERLPKEGVAFILTGKAAKKAQAAMTGEVKP